MSAALGWDNLSDPPATLTASGAVTLAPVSLLQNVHVGRKWRHNATATFVVADLGSLMNVDTVMLAGVSGEAPTFRVRYSTVDSTGAAGNAFDSGSISGLPYFDPDYGLFVHLKSTPASCRYVRVDISEAAVSFIEAGRLFVSEREAFTTNMQTPWSRSAVKAAVDTVGVGGQTYTDFRLGHWRTQAAFQFITETERNDFIEAIGLALVNLGRIDMLWISDTASTNLARDCIWGYLEQDLTATQNIYIIPPLFSVEFPIRQRL